MVTKLESLRADLERERAGSWQQALHIIPDTDVKFLVSSIHLPAYTVARNLTFQRLARIHKNNVPDDVVMAEVGKLFAEHILHGWQGFDVDYSKVTALKILSDPANRELIKAIEYCAGEAGRIDIEFAAESVPNSERPSARK